MPQNVSGRLPDLDEALRLANGIVILRDGSIMWQGNRQDILLHPADY